MRHTPELELDRALESGWPVEDPTVADLNDLASRVEHWLTCEPPPARQQRALFAAGVVGVHRARPSRAFKPALAAAALLVTLGWVGGNALPGDTLYPVREVLEKVGLAQSAVEQIDELIDTARTKVESGESALDDRPALAQRLAGDAINDLNDATRLLGEVSEETGRRAALIAGLELRAARVIERALDALGTGDLPGAKMENIGDNDEGRRRDSDSNVASGVDDDGSGGGNSGGGGTSGGNDNGDDGPNANEDDANEGQQDDANEGQQDDATGDDKDDGGAVSARDGDDADEPDAGDANDDGNDTGDGDDPEEINPNDPDDAELDQEEVD